MVSAIDVALLAVIAILVAVLLARGVQPLQNLASTILQLLQNGSILPIPNATPPSNLTVINTPRINQSQLDGYALSLINQDRAKFGLAPVTLSSEPSGQQHSDSMLQYDYFSHWDVYGMKPYMRYTLVGGKEGVSENIAYETNRICTLNACVGDLNITGALQSMEYNFMYNDSACCNNGHRDNILNANHTQVSIGIAYNSSTVYFTEDFINNYINWSSTSPAYSSSGEFYLDGSLLPGYSLSQIFVSYDPVPTNYSAGRKPPAGSYGYGPDIAGVVQSSLYYYPNLSTIVADTYRASGSGFGITFNLKKLVQQYGAGEYTMMTVLNNTYTQQSFLASTYTIFINSAGQQYVPSVI